MIIKKMRASFGCLENAEIEFGEGLNIITAANESGKSTWCAFIKAMLYGIDSAQREKGGVKPDKVKFAPWSGKPMSGEMDIEHEGKALTLRRSTKAPNAPMREFSAVYTGSADSAGIKGSEAGQVLTGIPKAVFESSVFVRQSGISVSNSAELEKRINAIISTGGDEAASYTDADDRLRAWQRKRRHNRSGAIPALDADIAEKTAALSGMEDAVAQRARLEMLLEAALEGETLAERLAAKEEEARRSAEIAELEELRSKKTEAENAYLAARERSQAALLETGKGPFPGKTLEEAEAQAKADAEKLAEMRSSIPSSRASIIMLAISFAAILGAYFTNNAIIGIIGVIGVPLFVAAIVSFMIIKNRRKDVEEAAADILKLYGCKTPEAILAKVKDYAVVWEALDKAKKEEEAAEKAMEDARSACRSAEAELLAMGRSGDSEALIRAKANTADVRRRIDQNAGRLQAMGDPMVTSTELDDLRTRREELSGEYEALALAIDTLREANDELQQRFAPALGRRAAEIMSRLTGGKYTSLSFDRNLDATAKRDGDTVAHEKAFLSEGTADQLYLALRLAICELALPEGKSCPLILDDALVNFDDERMGYALEVLKDIAKERQVILFSCHDREEKYING